MIRPFGILVERAEAVVRPVRGILLTGPSLGGTEAGQRLTVRGAFSQPSSTTVLAVVNFHRAEGHRSGVLISDAIGEPSSLRGAVVYEEGILFRVFGGVTSQPSVRASARYELRSGIARGLLRIDKGVIDAFILGGGLAEGADLWKELVEIKFGESGSLGIDDIRPFGPAWLVPALRQYRRGSHTAVIAGFCGPASPDFSLVSVEPDSTYQAYVMTQQANGSVQVDVDRRLKSLPLLASWSPSMSRPDGEIYEHA